MPLTSLPSGRQSGLWTPQRKPWASRGRFELDPRAALARGLQMALVPDGPAGVGGLNDFATPSRTFTASGSPSFTTGQFGNQVNCGFGTATALSFTPTMTAPTSAFSFSALCQFDGSGHGDTGFVLLSDGVSAHEIVSAQTSLNSPLSIGGGTGTHLDSSAIFLAVLTGWHRIGATYDGTNIRFFLDGKFTDSAGPIAISTPGPPSQFLADTGDGSFSWGWNVADAFYWNRTLADSEMMKNFVAPYKSVLRPRFSDSNIVGPGVVPKKGSLMLLGVG